MKRRDVLMAAPVAGLAAVTAGAVAVEEMEGNVLDSLVTPKDRLAFIAETLDVPMPAGLPSNLEDRDGAPCVEVLAFCKETDASLDYIYLGDIRPMIRGDYYRRRKAVTETPVMALFREWRVYHEWINSHDTDGVSNDEFDRLVDVATEMEGRILDMPCQGMQDFMFKVMAYTYFGEGALPDRFEKSVFWADARKLVGGVA